MKLSALCRSLGWPVTSKVPGIWHIENPIACIYYERCTGWYVCDVPVHVSVVKAMLTTALIPVK